MLADSVPMATVTKADKKKQTMVFILCKAVPVQALVVMSIRSKVEKEYFSLARNLSEHIKFLQTLLKVFRNRSLSSQCHAAKENGIICINKSSA